MKTGDTGRGDPIDRLEAGARIHRRPQRTPECPDENRLRLLLPGQVDDREAEQLLTHASECDWCGAVLREAANDLVDPPSPAEEELAAAARLADPLERRKLARRITGVKSSDPKPGFFLLRWWPAAGFASAAAAVATAGVLFQAGMLGGIPGARRLTCRAYTEQRELPMRLMACPAYVPLRIERGAGDARSLMDRPDLEEANARIARSAASHPQDPVWLDLQGRMDLLDGRDEPAIAKLERARTLRPHDPVILSDLGMAYFARAETKKENFRFYGQAFDRLSEASQLEPRDPALLFNRAVAAEKAFGMTTARQSWEAYLQVDSTSGWAREAALHLDSLKKNSAASGDSLTQPPQPR